MLTYMIEKEYNIQKSEKPKNILMVGLNEKLIDEGQSEFKIICLRCN